MMSNVIDLDEHRDDCWELGLCICTKCHMSYGTMRHTKTNKNKLECPTCGFLGNIYISEHVVSDFLEMMEALR